MPGDPTTLQRLRHAGRGVRWLVHSVMGDNAYANYVRHLHQEHPGAPVPTERDFWKARYAEQEANPKTRCC